jgi:sec-independent protein translocase protein TatC
MTALNVDQSPPSEARMTLRDHISELRSRMFKSALGVVVGCILGVFLLERIIDFMVAPYREATGDPDRTLKILSPTEGVTIKIKLITYIGLFLGSPVWLYQIWRFIAPALHRREKRYAIPFVFASMALFTFGGFVAVLTMPQAMKFFDAINGEDFESFYSPGNYISLYALIVLAFGICFEFPVVLVALQLAGAVTSKSLLKGWRYAIVIVAVIAAVATPSQDPYTLFAMAGPMWVFYFGAIAVGKAFKK